MYAFLCEDFSMCIATDDYFVREVIYAKRKTTIVVPTQKYLLHKMTFNSVQSYQQDQAAVDNDRQIMILHGFTSASRQMSPKS